MKHPIDHDRRPDRLPRPQRRWSPIVAVEGATVLSGTANGITNVVLPWLVLERTGSATAAALVAAATALPLLLSSLVAGTIVDRFGRRRASMVADVLSGLSVAAIPVMVLFTDLALGSVIALAVLGAAFDPVGVTARESMLPDAAGAAGVRLERMNGIHEAAWGLSLLVGPGIGGVLIGAFGPENALWATAGAFAASCLVMALARIPGAGGPVRVTGAPRPSFVAQTREGLSFVRHDRLLLSLAVISTMLAATYLPIEGVLLPVYFQSQNAPERLGLILLTMSAGWILGSLLYGAIGSRFPRRALFVTAAVGTTTPLILMAFLPPLPLLLLAGAASGFLYGPVNPIMNLVLQVRTPPALRGRVIGLVKSAGYAAGPLGYLVAGPLVDRIGLQPTFFVVVGAVVLAGLSTLLLPALRELDNLDATRPSSHAHVMATMGVPVTGGVSIACGPPEQLSVRAEVVPNLRVEDRVDAPPT